MIASETGVGFERMRVSVVSDIHGNIDDLARVAGSAEQLVVLGDLLDYIDYHDSNGGIFGAVFGPDAVERMARLRAAGDFKAYHAYDRELWSTVANPRAVLDEVVAARYERVAAVLPPDTLITLGNVDVEHVWRAVAPPNLAPLDGEVVVLRGARLGFVGGGALREPPPASPWKSFDRSHEQFRSALARIGDVDVLCTHVPPKIADMRLDTVAEREEMYGPGVREFIEARQPVLALSGHVHHPRAREATIGSTRCVNVGYFRRCPTPFVFDTDDL